MKIISFFKRIILKITPFWLVQMWSVNKILIKYGYLKSVKLNIPVNQKGEPVPWFTYPAIFFIDQFDLTDSSVFEYGCGNSSFFFARKAKRVISVEDNKDWFDKISQNKPNNLQVEFKIDKDDYISEVKKHGKKFDIILIDANHRLECCKVAKEYLNEGGIIILDNSEDFIESSIYLKNELKMTQIDFIGAGPINGYAWVTSVFFTNGYKFKTVGAHPSIPIGGIIPPELR